MEIPPVEKNEADSTVDRFNTLLEEARRELATAPANALPLVDQCVQMAIVSGWKREECIAWRVCGQVHRAIGQHDEAVNAFAAAASSARSIEDYLLAAQVQIGAVDSFAMLGRISDAAALAERLIRDFKEFDSPLDAAKVLCNLGSVYLRQDRYAEALKCYTDADVAFEQMEQEGASNGIAIMRALVQVNRAIALTHLDDVDAALQLYEAARNTYNAAGLEAEAAVVETNIAFLHQVSGWYAGALGHLNRAHEIFSAQERPHEAARCDIDRGEAYRGLNLLPEAVECYEKARETFLTLPLNYDQARADMGKAAALLSMGQVAEGMEALDQAEAAFDRLQNFTQLAHIKLIRASRLHAAGNYEESYPLALAALRAFKRRQLFGWAAEARYLVAYAEMMRGKRPLLMMQAVRRVARQTRRGWLESRAEQALARYELSRRQVPKALRHYRQGIAALESLRTLAAPDEMHTSFLKDKMDIYAEIIAVLLERGRPKDIEAALDYAERSRSRVLLDRLVTAQSQAKNSSTVQARLNALRGALARAQQQERFLQDENDPRRFTDTAPGTIVDLEQTYARALQDAQLDQTLATENGSLREEVSCQNTVPLFDIQANLQADETLVSFYALGEKFVAFVITQSGLEVVHLHVQSCEIARASRRLRYHLQKMQMGNTGKQDLFPLRESLRAEMDGVMKQFYRYLMEPLVSHLRDDHRLIIIPFGELHGLPFHAFHDGERYAADRWDISYAPSATVWCRLAQIPVPADIRYDDKVRIRTAKTGETHTVDAEQDEHRGLSPVLVGVPGPGIERVASEVKLIGCILAGARVLIGEDATTKMVTQAAQTASLLHIAAHAQFRKDNPQFSAIVLTDGWLLARDVYEMTLPGSLVVLSACETAISQVQPGDELFGLIRAFLTAGARAVVGCFWPADDEATAELMARFYDKRDRGISDSSALRLAQKEIRHLYPHPYHWAAFGLVGIGYHRKKVQE